MQASVSVVIPVRNAARYLGEALRSVLAQQHPAAEIIVVDNGSTDASRRLAESFGPAVRVIDEPRPGACFARNSGVDCARGEYLAFLDADDLWLPGKLERQLRQMESRRGLDMIFTWGENFLSPELTEAERRTVRFASGAGPFILPSTMLARRASFLKAGPIPDLGEGEFIAWYGIAMAMGMQSDVIAEVLVRRRVHLTNSTRVAAKRHDLLRAARLVLDRKRAAGGAES